ncbi:hypothetical protein, partial [Faecalibaculum rodentium]|uniref:hypothetical protein n=1 Tax=Faecalibaculum rodentium TaxID=1702221 RepID=UPI0027151749
MWTAFFSTPVTCTSPGTFGTASSHDIYHYKKALSFSILKLIRKGEFLIMNKKQLLIRSGVSVESNPSSSKASRCSEL